MFPALEVIDDSGPELLGGEALSDTLVSPGKGGAAVRVFIGSSLSRLKSITDAWPTGATFGKGEIVSLDVGERPKTLPKGDTCTVAREPEFASKHIVIDISE